MSSYRLASDLMHTMRVRLDLGRRSDGLLRVEAAFSVYKMGSEDSVDEG